MVWDFARPDGKWAESQPRDQGGVRGRDYSALSLDWVWQAWGTAHGALGLRLDQHHPHGQVHKDHP